MLEVLTDFKTANPPLEWLLEACPPLAPRYFSISSSLRLVMYRTRHLPSALPARLATSCLPCSLSSKKQKLRTGARPPLLGAEWHGAM